MPKKEVWLSVDEIEYIKQHTGGTYSNWIAEAVRDRIEKEKSEQLQENTPNNKKSLNPIKD